MKNGWKIVAIVFIVICIVETIAFGSLIAYGLSLIRQESQCTAICNTLNTDAYEFDDYTGICTCFRNGQVAQRILP